MRPARHGCQPGHLATSSLEPKNSNVLPLLAGALVAASVVSMVSVIKLMTPRYAALQLSFFRFAGGSVFALMLWAWKRSALHERAARIQQFRLGHRPGLPAVRRGADAHDRALGNAHHRGMPAEVAPMRAQRPSAAMPARAICASSFDLTPLTPTAPTHWSFTITGTPPSSMPSSRGALRNDMRPWLIISS